MPGWSSRVTEPLRSGLRDAVSGLREGPRGLVPALVVGDESLMVGQVREDMGASGLLHLNAVSGTNVTIVLVAVLGLARWVGVRGYGLPALAVLAIAGFVLLARPEPSVVRAAVMGIVAMLGLTVAGRRRGVSALATAVLVLLLVDPWLGTEAGFALSVLATAGILFLAPAWREAMPWAPRPVAEALAVPLAAQVACAPVVVAVAAQASLASIPANILVAPAVAPATVLGAAAAVVSAVSATGGLGARSARGTAGRVDRPRRSARRRSARRRRRLARWSGGCSARCRRRRGVGAAAARTAEAAADRYGRRGRARRRPGPGADTRAGRRRTGSSSRATSGQGDALVLRAGQESAVVVDAGPDPRAVHRCLDSLGVEQVPLLVLTHFHADHVDGVPGVLDGRRVDQVLVSPLDDPREQADDVTDWLADARVPVAVARAGDEISVGDAVRLRVLWPRRIIADGSMANNASIVLEADLDGARFVLAGDIEPEAQRALRVAEPGLRADVLKVPHHGSVHQDAELLTGLGAGLALVSAGADNAYGHPAPETIELLERSGVAVLRTDLDGSIAVVQMPGDGLGVVAGGPRVVPPP